VNDLRVERAIGRNRRSSAWDGNPVASSLAVNFQNQPPFLGFLAH
jgi:hypothetical protein